MQNNITLKNLRGLFTKTFAIICLLLSVAGLHAQTVVSTASGVNYNGDYSLNNPAVLVQSFAVQNTNATDVVLTEVDMQMAPYFGNSGPSAINLYYSATSLSGPFTAPGPGWTLVGSYNTVVPPALDIIPVLAGLNFVIPAGAQYRFAVEVSKGMAFSFNPTPTPNNFTNGGVVLQVGDFQIAGQNIGYAGVSPTPAVGNTPSFFGGSITVYPSTACSGTPTPGGTVSTVSTVCPSIFFTLSQETPPPPGTTGVTYQWQSSSTVGGPYSDIGGATNATLTTSQTAATYYQVIVTCGANSTTSTPTLVALTPQSGCYCDAGSPDVDFEKIANVTFNTINNPSTSTGSYENFLAVSTDVVQQSTTPITVTLSDGFGSDQVIVWIDFNHNGNFNDAGEKVYTSGQGAGPHTGNITIPASSLLGPTRMRIRLFDSFFDPTPTSCGDTEYGQVEDYTVNIVPCVQGVIGTSPANATVVCGGATSFSVLATGSVLTYKWEQRISATDPWTNITDGGVFSDATTPNLQLTKVPSSMNGYQYRAIVEGPCTAIIASNAGTLTVTPLIATVDPVDPEICNGSIQALSITNTEPPPSFCSGPISVAIPDGSFPGPYTATTSTVNVSGVPAAAVITKLNVTLNVTHAYVGDLVIVLKSPSGKVFNLDAVLTFTNNPGADFVNTIISSAGTDALGDGTEPFTGIFAPDAAGATFNIAGFDLPGGPPGFIPNTTTMSDLFATDVNGTWTLAMYDAGAPDAGELTSWCLDFSYGAASTGVFGPTAQLGTIWTDPAATIPYDGTSQINTVYVNPTTTTTYNVVVTTSTCVSDPLPITVTVGTTISNVSTVADVSGCIDGTATFSVTAEGTVQHYQWQESTDGGTTWTNVADGGIYSGSTTADLTLTGLSDGEDGNLYQVIVSNACNSITSNAATLTVNPIPTVTIATTVSQLYPGIVTTLTSSVSPAGASYQWFKNGVAVTGATGSSLQVDIDAIGDYTLTAVDVNGCSNSSNTLSIISIPNDILFIYPSPNTGQFQVRYQSLAGNVVPRTLTIYDSKGSRVYTKEYIINAPYGRMDVDMGTHARGVYRVELGDRNGNRIKTGSVLIL